MKPSAQKSQFYNVHSVGMLAAGVPSALQQRTFTQAQGNILIITDEGDSRCGQRPRTSLHSRFHQIDFLVIRQMLVPKYDGFRLRGKAELVVQRLWK